MKASVVVATYNRAELARALLLELAAQIDAPAFEVVVVDDGSREDPRPLLSSLSLPFRLVLARQVNQGAAAARDHGASLACGDILIFIDDDMKVPPRFVASHIAAHQGKPSAVVLGHMRADARLAEMPVFERFHARQLDRMVASFRAGVRPKGLDLFTGNVSMRRADYLAVGGFDRSLGRSEDAELGIRLEKLGATFAFSADAYTVHASDHVSLETWLRRAFLYGKFDHRIAAKHHDRPDVSPWRFLHAVNPISRPLLTLSALSPRASLPLARAMISAALRADAFGMDRLAVAGATVVFGMQYFRGVRDESDGTIEALRDYRRYRANTRAADARTRTRGAGMTRLKRVAGAWSRMVRAVRADHATMQHYHDKYQSSDGRAGLAADLVQRVGFQMMAGYRLMRFFVESDVPLAPKVVSRTMRILYGSDIHWDAKIAEGVVIVHGMGMAISRSATIGKGTILFQNVTLAESSDPVTREVGAPTIEDGVHVGPGSTIIGPVTIGASSKLVAGSIVLRSIPPGSRVEPTPPTVTERRVVAQRASES